MSRPLFCPWQENIAAKIEEKRKNAIASLGLAEEKAFPIFDEATQTVADSLNFPICCLGILTSKEYKIKSAYGLSHLGLMNELAKSRKIPREEAYATYVVDSHQYLLIENSFIDTFFCHSLLSQQYGIVSYLGVPLIIHTGECIGCLEILDTKSRQFSQAEIKFLMITARWCIAEHERTVLQKSITFSTNTVEHQQKSLIIQTNISTDTQPTTSFSDTESEEKSEQYIRELSFQLLYQLTQKLSIPLTSIIGMSSVLKQGIYGKLNNKQSEYLQIIHDSGQEMNILVDEIAKLTNLKNEINLEYSLVDLENLGQQIIQNLESSAKNREHTLKLFIEPGEKICHLDRGKFKKTLYYLVNSMIEGSRSGSEIRLHLSRRGEFLRVNCLVNHPWLGEGLSLEKINLYQEVLAHKELKYNLSSEEHKLTVKNNSLSNYNYDLVCLSFSNYLANLQRGNISLQGSVESGYRFLLSIPIPN